MQTLHRRELLAGTVAAALWAAYTPHPAVAFTPTELPVRPVYPHPWMLLWRLPDYQPLDPFDFTFRTPSVRIHLEPQNAKFLSINVGPPHSRTLKKTIRVEPAMQMMDTGPVVCIDTATWEACRWTQMQPEHQYLHLMLDHQRRLLAVDLFTLEKLNYDRRGTSNEPVAHVYDHEDGYVFLRLWNNDLVTHVEGTTAGA